MFIQGQGGGTARGAALSTRPHRSDVEDAEDAEDAAEADTNARTAFMAQYQTALNAETVVSQW